MTNWNDNITTENQENNNNNETTNKTIAFNCLIKLKYGTEIKMATLNIRGIKRLGKREK